MSVSQPSPLLSLVAYCIRLYQRTISPDHGLLRWVFPAGVCRFRPTCSDYMLESIQERGWAGIVRGVRRLGHCHPYGGAL